MPAEVETGCATMTEAECDGAICSCARTVPDGGGMAEVDEAMMYETGAANLILWVNQVGSVIRKNKTRA